MNRVKDVLREGSIVVGAAVFPRDDLAFLAGSGFDVSLYPREGGQKEVSRLVLS